MARAASRPWLATQRSTSHAGWPRRWAKAAGDSNNGVRRAADCVDHAGGVWVGCGAAELDTFVEGGVRRDAVHVQQLERAQAQGDGHGFGEALVGAREQFG